MIARSCGRSHCQQRCTLDVADSALTQRHQANRREFSNVNADDSWSLVVLVRFWRAAEVSECALRFRLLSHTRPIRRACETSNMTSRPEEFHLRALPEPCMTVSSHTAPDVRPLP